MLRAATARQGGEALQHYATTAAPLLCAQSSRPSPLKLTGLPSPTACPTTPPPPTRTTALAPPLAPHLVQVPGQALCQGIPKS